MTSSSIKPLQLAEIPTSPTEEIIQECHERIFEQLDRIKVEIEITIANLSNKISHLVSRLGIDTTTEMQDLILILTEVIEDLKQTSDIVKIQSFTTEKISFTYNNVEFNRKLIELSQIHQALKLLLSALSKRALKLSSFPTAISNLKQTIDNLKQSITVINNKPNKSGLSEVRASLNIKENELSAQEAKHQQISRTTKDLITKLRGVCSNKQLLELLKLANQYQEVPISLPRSVLDILPESIQIQLIKGTMENVENSFLEGKEDNGPLEVRMPFFKPKLTSVIYTLLILAGLLTVTSLVIPKSKPKHGSEITPTTFPSDILPPEPFFTIIPINPQNGSVYNLAMQELQTELENIKIDFQAGRVSELETSNKIFDFNHDFEIEGKIATIKFVKMLKDEEKQEFIGFFSLYFESNSILLKFKMNF